MGEVKYSINGKYFKDYGIYVSSSLGLLDALKRKPIKTYDWPEYHGESLDLSNPKFEAREIVLNCFIKGDNYQQMFDNFRNVVLSEFQKSGTQRLLVEPFGYKSLPFEVYLSDEVKIAKEFSESTSIGVFSIKLIEPNPIKKVLYITSDTLNLSYNSSKETEIFFVNGEKTTAKGNVSLSNKTLANRSVSGYDFEGRNLLAKGNLEIGAYLISDATPLLSNKYIRTKNKIEILPSTPYKWKVFKNIGLWSVVFLYFDKNGWYIGYENADEESVTTSPPNAKYLHINIYDNPENTKPLDIDYVNSNINFSLQKGFETNSFSIAPEDEKYIIIAGDVDGITNLTTNATVLWEKL